LGVLINEFDPWSLRFPNTGKTLQKFLQEEYYLL
jgi:hypothetical protein